MNSIHVCYPARLDCRRVGDYCIEICIAPHICHRVERVLIDPEKAAMLVDREMAIEMDESGAQETLL